MTSASQNDNAEETLLLEEPTPSSLAKDGSPDIEAMDYSTPLAEQEDPPPHMTKPMTRMFSEASTSAVSQASVPTTASALLVRIIGAVANLCSATLGAGILALPFAMYQAGLVCGILLMLASAWGTAASIDLLVVACDSFRMSTYESVVQAALGRKWRQIVEVSILIFCVGTAVAYVIAVGDIVQRVEDLEYAQTRLAMSLVWLLAMLPLSCLRRMQSLQCASSIGIISIGTLLVAATVHLFLPTDPQQSGLEFDFHAQAFENFLWPHQGAISVLRACPIFFFAYSCQVNVAQIYEEMPGTRGEAATGMESKRVQMKWVAWTSIGLCSLLYSGISIVALLDFGDNVKPNILSCYGLQGRESALLHIAFLAMALAVVMAFPLNIFPARVSILQMWEALSKQVDRRPDPMLLCINDDAQQPLLAKNDEGSGGIGDNDAMERGFGDDPLRPPTNTHARVLAQSSTLDSMPGVEDEDPAEERFDFGQHVVVSLLVAGSALGLALVVPNISVVFGLLGGTTSALLGFVVPGLLGLEVDRSDKKAWTLVVAGTMIGVLTTGVTIYSTIAEAL
eukprot:Nitzschia sp. Nitz4//scaffold7_size249615//223583//225280//NITZ4_001212-RA/size249615-processed-gene-0.162-mRNA-1//1//CDS//3329558547//2047//frame0